MKMNKINRLSEQVGKKLKSSGHQVVVAESCTGGGLAEAITSIPGSSEWFDRGFVTYSNASKIEMLGVNQDTLDAHGAVSEEVAIEMAEGALRHSHAHLSIAITGIAGPIGGDEHKPVGMVWFAWAGKGIKTETALHHFKGDRQSVREQSIEIALQGLSA